MFKYMTTDFNWLFYENMNDSKIKFSSDKHENKWDFTTFYIEGTLQ